MRSATELGPKGLQKASSERLLEELSEQASPPLNLDSTGTRGQPEFGPGLADAENRRLNPSNEDGLSPIWTALRFIAPSSLCPLCKTLALSFFRFQSQLSTVNFLILRPPPSSLRISVNSAPLRYPFSFLF